MARRNKATEAKWREQLTREQYDVLRRKGTERPFSGEYVDTKDDGTYRCAGCGAELFSSETKFDSGTGWPSFTDPAVAANVELHADNGLFMRRTEVTCRAAAATSAMSSPTDRTDATATASTLSRSRSTRARGLGPAPSEQTADIAGLARSARIGSAPLAIGRWRAPIVGGTSEGNRQA